MELGDVLLTTLCETWQDSTFVDELLVDILSDAADAEKMPALFNIEQGLDVVGGVVLVFAALADDDVLVEGADVDHGFLDPAIDFSDDG